MDENLIQKNEEEVIYYPKSHAFKEELDNKTTMRGFEAYQAGETKNRVTRSIERLSRHATLSEDEVQQLKESVTEEPMFGTEEGAEFKTLLTKAQKKQLGYFKKKRYNKKEAAYKAQLGTWEFENLSKLYEQEERVYKRFYEAEVAEVTLEDKVDSIDKEFFAQSDKFFMLDEDKKAKADEQKLLDIGIKKQVKAYTGRKYKAYNRYLRDPSYSKISEEDKKDVERMKQGLKQFKIDHTIIVNRGLPNVRRLADMLGMNSDVPSYDLNPDEMQKVIKQSVEHIKKNQKEGKEIILTDPGFVSTSYNPNNTFADMDTGIEFVIKVNKGTEAVNLATLSTYSQEKEILLNAGTKFRFVKMYYSGTDKIDGLDYKKTTIEQTGKKDTVKHGRFYLKVYLETIPPEEDGVLKNS